ncbi:hypothetical protein [Moraxella catarrhalis]|nr:hypothetical protein [Moraxella catarrhalis]
MGDKHICRFDSGIIGFIYAEKEKIRQEFGVERITKEIEAKVAKQFERRLELQSQYLNGEVYCFFIYRVNTAEFEKYGEHCLERSEVLDSCTGYYQKCDAIFDMLDMLENLSKNAA